MYYVLSHKTQLLNFARCSPIGLTRSEVSLALFVVRLALPREAVGLVVVAKCAILDIDICRTVGREPSAVILNVTLPC